MKSLLIYLVLTAAGLLLVPPVQFVQAAQTATGGLQVAQPLVREGDFAMKLAAALNLGPANNETEAESALASAGISPRNGWVSDYPLTPDITGELRDSVDRAARAGSLPMDGGKALSLLEDLEVDVGVAVVPDTSGAYADAQVLPYPEDAYDTAAVSSYYDDEGPPVVTYYAPPPDYSYLYCWVPYPFWWSGAWFGGFYVLNDFDVAAGDHGYYHHHFHGRDGFERHGSRFASGEITNHVRDPRTGHAALIDPARRTGGRTFRTVSDFNRTNGGGTDVGRGVHTLSRTGSGWTSGAFGREGARGSFAAGPSGSGSRSFGESNFRHSSLNSTMPSRMTSGSLPPGGSVGSSGSFSYRGTDRFSGGGVTHSYGSGGFSGSAVSHGFSGGCHESWLLRRWLRTWQLRWWIRWWIRWRARRRLRRRWRPWRRGTQVNTQGEHPALSSHGPVPPPMLFVRKVPEDVHPSLWARAHEGLN